jgi:hypothetical protein
VEEAAKMVVVLDQSSIDKAVKTSGDNASLAGPSIQALSSPEGASPIKVSSDLSP